MSNINRNPETAAANNLLRGLASLPRSSAKPTTKTGIALNMSATGVLTVSE
jgi:hypothetical protein